MEEQDLAIVFHDKIVRNDVKACEKMLKNGVRPDSKMSFTTKTVTCVNKRLVSRELVALPLHVSCIYRRPGIVQLLLRYGADPNGKDKMGRTPLLLALSYWPRLMYVEPIPIHFTKEEIAYQHYLRGQHEKSEQILSLLCEGAADVNTTFEHSHYNGSTLHHAVEYNVIPAFKILLKFGANIEAKDTMHRTPLILAAKLSRFTCMNILGSSGADVNTKDNKGNTPLHYVCLTDVYQDIEAIDYILSLTADTDVQNNDGNTPLHLTCMFGNEEATRALIYAGASVDITNNIGTTPLFHLMNNDELHSTHKGIVNLIVNESRQVNIYDHEGHLPSLLNVPSNAELKTLLTSMSRSPNSLQMRCRSIIRLSVRKAKYQLTDLEQLQIPSPIFAFLAQDMII